MSDDTNDLSASLAVERDAFARLYNRYAAIVLSLCRRRDRSLQEAEDAMQETFLRAYRLLDKAKGQDRFHLYLFRIAGYVCSERSRAARRRARHESDAGVHHIRQRSDVLNPAEATARVEQLERLTEALNTLPCDQRLAVHLHYLAPDPAAAASASLGLSRPGYYKLLARARMRLAVHMREGHTV